MRSLIPCLVFASLIAGCGGDDPVTPEDTSYSVTVTVVDAAGAPVEGINVNIVNDVFVDADKVDDVGDDPGDAMVILPIQVLEASLVRVRVLDIEGATLRTVVSTGMSAGRNLVQWDGRDDDGIAQPSGRYSLSVIAFPAEGNVPLFSRTVDVFLRRTRASFTLGMTDTDGVYSTIDMRILPGLYFLEDMIATDAVGQRNGILNVLETATITVWRDGEPSVSETIAVIYGPNPVRIIYDTSDLVVEDSPPSKSRAPSTRLVQSLDEPVWGLGDPYPNPFN